MKKHLKCWLWKLLWVLSAVALVCAWIGYVRGVPFVSFDPLFALWNAMILGVLAVSIKLDCADCATCKVSSSM